MKSSTSPEEWNANVATVRLMFNGQLPPFWHAAIHGSGLAHRKEREWAEGLDELLGVPAGDRAGNGALRGFHIVAPMPVPAPGLSPQDKQLQLANHALLMCRTSMRHLGVPAVVWLTAVGMECATMAPMGAPAEPRAEFERRLEDLLASIRGDAWTNRTQRRAAKGLPDDSAE
jgi:hypothetical protein